MKISAIALNTFRESIRNKILYSVLLFAVLLIAVSAFFATVSIGDRSKVIADFGFFALSFFGAILTIVSGISLLNKELKQKTIYNILSKPVARWQFIVGKFLGLAATVSLLISLMGVGLIAFLSFFGEVSIAALTQGILFTVFEVVVISAVTIFFSSIVITTTLAAIFTLATYIAGRSINYFSFFLEDNSSPSLVAIISVLDKILPDLSVFNIANQVVYGETISSAHIFTALAYSVSYSAVLVILAGIIFSRREML